MNLFTVTIPDSAAALLVTYGAGALIRVQSSPTQAGVYGDVTTIPIVSGQAVYSALDDLGTVTDWYKIRYEAADGDPAGSYSVAFQPMPLTGVYATLADFNLFLRDAGTDTSDDTLKLLALDAASRAIDRTCNRRFDIAGAAQTARLFTPDPDYGEPWTATRWASAHHRHYRLPIDDTFDAAATVMYDTTGEGDYTTAITDFRLSPINAAVRGRPYTELVLDWRTPYDVQVTAVWGWDSVPTAITTATLLQASRFYRRRDAPFGIAGSPDVGSEMRLLAKLDPDVAVIVGPYKRWWAAA